MGPQLSRSIQYAIERRQMEIKQRELTAAEARAEADRKRSLELEKACNDLREKTDRLERFQKVTVGRELDMIRLKKEVNELLEKMGNSKKYETPDQVKE